MSGSSSTQLKHVQLGAAELYMLDKLSSRIFLCANLPSQDEDACQVLHTHGLAWRRTAFMAGHGDMLAWDISSEGWNYLVRQYRKQGGHV